MAVKDYSKSNAKWVKDENISSKHVKRGGRKHRWSIEERQGALKYMALKEKDEQPN